MNVKRLDLASCDHAASQLTGRATPGAHPWRPFDVALINRSALGYLLGRGYQLQSFPMIWFSDAELGQLDRYILFSPCFLA